MKLTNCRVENYDELVDIIIEDGKIIKIASKITESDKETIDIQGNLISAPFVEPHIHFDATQTAGEPEWNLSGTLFEGIERWGQRKKSLTEDDVVKRACQTIRECSTHGIQFFRTHIDVTDPQLTALKAMKKVKEVVKDICDIQVVAFPQDGIISVDGGKELMEQAVKLGADVIGAIPHYEFTREYGVESIKFVIEMAEKNNLLVDIHCDEIDDEQSRFLETIAAEALKRKIGDRVTASHTCAMGSYNDAYTCKLFNLLKKSGISFVSCPTESIHLQGRFDTYPKRRGITRVKELDKVGMNVCFGEDSIRDPWYPFGNGNILNVLFHSLHITQLMGYSDICQALRFITANSAKALRLKNYGIYEGADANLIVLNAKSVYDTIRTQADVLYSVHKGRLIFKTEPAHTAWCL